MIDGAGEDVLRGLSQTWRERMGDRPPLTYEYMLEHRDRWVRFHTLPESQRYAANEAERLIIQRRHNTVLEGLFAGEDIYVMTTTWSDGPEPEPRKRLDRRVNPGSVLWWSFLDNDDPDPAYVTYAHVYVSWTSWSAGSLNRLLSAVADFRTANAAITDRHLRRMYHPYDGGADILALDGAERDMLRERHADWLSSHPSGM